MPPVYVEDPVITSTLPTPSDTDNEDNKKQDDMYQYNICLRRFGLICLEFHDAIKEGDGNRIFTCWKFLLLLFKGDEKGSTKCHVFYYISEQCEQGRQHGLSLRANVHVCPYLYITPSLLLKNVPKILFISLLSCSKNYASFNIK